MVENRVYLKLGIYLEDNVSPREFANS